MGSESPIYFDEKTLIDMFLRSSARYGKREALVYKDKSVNAFVAISWKQWEAFVRKTALGLNVLGIKHGGRVAILSENRPEWTYADLGTLALGAVTVPIYATSSADDIAYILKAAEVEVIFVSNADQLLKVQSVVDQCPDLKKIIVFDHDAESMPSIDSFEDLLVKGRCAELNHSGLFEELSAKVDAEDLATLIFTSGTTGNPKGVMLTHRNFIENYMGASQYIPVSERDISISFLPLSHVFERLAGYYFMISSGAVIAYAENMNTVAEDIVRIKPTVAAAVPRFYEKIYAKIHEVIECGPPLRKKIFYWAIETGKKYRKVQSEHGFIGLKLQLQYFLASALVLNKIRQKLGGRIRFFISGGAPLPKYLADFFYAANVLILEGYGLTETAPVIAVNAVHDFSFGTVGKPLPNVHVKISEQGEILTKSLCVMKGYYNNREATEEAIKDGWFHTGDIGEIDNRGFLKITDRIKDIIVTSGGKNIAPQKLEARIVESPLIQQLVILGDKRNYLVALIVPDRCEVEKRAQALGLEGISWEELIEKTEVYGMIDEVVQAKMEDLASYEQIKRFSLIANEFTQANGELTPTLKVKRKVIMEKYSKEIDALYSQQPAGKEAGC